MWTLDYDDAIFMRTEEKPEDLIAGSFYKLELHRYVKEVLPGLVRFKPELSYLQFKKIIALCQKESDKSGFSLTVSDALKNYIEERETYIYIRSRLGVELKNHDSKLLSRYNEYKIVVDNAMERKLRERQMWDSFFMCTMQKSANFSVPGSGKTASVLGMYCYLRSKKLVKRIVVICPKNAFGSWIDEFTACFGDIEPLNVLNIHDTRFTNNKKRLTALQYDAGVCNLILVNYESAGILIEGILPLVNSNALLVFDEVHRVKRINGKYAKQALRIANNASYVVTLTGTPIPNSYSDLYNLLHILYPNEYDEFFDLSVSMLRKPKVKEIDDINEKIQPFFCRTTKEQLGVPPANEDALMNMNASEAENRLFEILKIRYSKKQLVLLIRLMQMENDPKMLLEKLDLKDFDYLMDDTVESDEIEYANYTEDVQALINAIGTTTKFGHCVQLAESLVDQGKTVIIWCIFVHSINKLSSALRKIGIKTHCIYGEVNLEERQRILEKFRKGEIQVLLTNPNTLAESISLHNVCHDAIYYEYNYNLVHLLQSKDRIHRLGLPKEQYTQYYYETVYYQVENGSWSLDEAIYERLKTKERIMLDAIAERKLEIMSTSEEDLRIIFNKLNLDNI